VHRLDFIHHVFIDVQAPRSIDNQDIGMRALRLIQGPIDDSGWFFVRTAIAMQRTDFTRQCLQLQNSGGPVNVDAD